MSPLIMAMLPGILSWPRTVSEMIRAFDEVREPVRAEVRVRCTRDGASAIVRAITELAHALNIETTAEGVEETAQLMELRAHGCSSVQGFLFAEPMSVADVERLFKEDGGALKNVA